jgi:uncharacterized repeat protein (TIGR01451 family)
VDYTIGSSYTGIGFNSVSASVIGVLPHTVVNTLPNPIVNQPYTIRIFKDASTFSDISVLMPPKQCTTADLSVSVTVSPQTGNQGEILVYTITVTNNGPDTDPAVFVKIPIPNNVTYMSSTATQGSYNDLTKNWDVGSVANGVSKILTLSLKVN